MAEVFNITHDDVTLDEYDSTVTNGGDLSASVDAALAGTVAGLKCVCDDTNEMYGRKNPDAGGEFGVRFYLDPNSITINSGSSVRVVLWKNTGGTSIYQLYMQKPSATYQIRLYAWTDGGSNLTVATGDLADDGSNYIEFYVKKATGAGTNDGIARLWVSGVLIGELTNLDTDTVGTLNQLRAGKSDITGTVSGTYYVDEIKCRDDNTTIGPVVTGGVVPVMAYDYRRRRVL